MNFIKTIPEKEAEGDVLEMYQKLKGNREFLPNYARVFCYRPRVMEAWANLQREIRSTMDYRDYELITLAAAQELRNSYCSLAHGKVLTDRYFSESQLESITSDPESPHISDRDRAMMKLSRHVVRDTSSITENDINAVRQRGFSDDQIFDIVTAAAARCFIAKIPDALGVRPDPELGELPESLRNSLVVGRQIEGPVTD